MRNASKSESTIYLVVFLPRLPNGSCDGHHQHNDQHNNATSEQKASGTWKFFSCKETRKYQGTPCAGRLLGLGWFLPWLLHGQPRKHGRLEVCNMMEVCARLMPSLLHAASRLNWRGTASLASAAASIHLTEFFAPFSHGKLATVGHDDTSKNNRLVAAKLVLQKNSSTAGLGPFSVVHLLTLEIKGFIEPQSCGKIPPV